MTKMATSPSLPPIESLYAATGNDEILKSVLDTLFEPSPELHALAIPSLRDELSARNHDSPFTYTTLIEHVGGLLSSLAASPSPSSTSTSTSHSNPTPTPNPTLYAILGSHPRLGAKKVDSAQSRAEQAQLNPSFSSSSSSSDTNTEDKHRNTDELAALNAAYEARFPGLRYVVFVNGRGREAIAADARARIARGDAAAEERDIVRAMVDIALDRARKLGGGVVG